MSINFKSEMNLLQFKEKTEDKKRIEKLLKKARVELSAEKQKLTKLEKQLKKEFEDVQRLEEGGLTALFYEVLGSKEKKLDKERQEYLAAKLKYDNCKKVVQELEFDIENLQKDLLACGSPEIEYTRLLEEKKSGLKAVRDEKLLQYEELLDHFFSQKKEVNEAIYAGERAMQGLEYAMQSLRKAKGWGTVDMVGGGLLSTAIKRSNMNEAQELIQDVQVWLRRFKRELSDIRIREFADMDLRMDAFTSFADYFFDNLITDWVVQSKINNSFKGCENVYTQVSQIVSELKNTDTNLNKKYKSTKTEFTNYIEKS
jgi:hypothetical protein